MAEHADSTIWAYLAGIIDGEGSIGTTRTGKYRNVVGRLIVANTNEALLHTLKQRHGGTITKRKKAFGEGWKPFCSIAWTNRGALRILETVLPYLIVKRPQAEVCIRLIRMRDRPKNERFIFIHDPCPGMPSRHNMRVRPEVSEQEFSLAVQLKTLNRKGITSFEPPAWLS